MYSHGDQQCTINADSALLKLLRQHLNYSACVLVGGGGGGGGRERERERERERFLILQPRLSGRGSYILAPIHCRLPIFGGYGLHSTKYRLP